MNQKKTKSMSDLSNIFAEVLKNGGSFKLKVKGMSMYPLIRSNVDSVVLKAKPDVKKYDIVLYKRNNSAYVLHRIVKAKNGAFWLAGDFETSKEYPVYPQQIVAAVTSIWRGDREISCNSMFYQLYARVWVFIMPFRFTVVRSLRRMKKWATARR